MTDATNPSAKTEPVAWLLTHPTEPTDVELATSRDPITDADRKAGWSSEPLYRGGAARSDHRSFVNRVGRMPHPADDDYAYPSDDDSEREALNGLIADAREIMSRTHPRPLDREEVLNQISDLCTSFNDHMHDIDDVLGQINQLAYAGMSATGYDSEAISALKKARDHFAFLTRLANGGVIYEVDPVTKKRNRRKLSEVIASECDAGFKHCADAILALAAPAEGYVLVPVDTLAEALFTADRLRKNVTPDWIGLPRDHKDEWRRKAALAAQPSADPQTGRWYAAEDIDRMVREIDVAMNGEGAAQQAKLCDVFPQIIKLAAAQPSAGAQPDAYVERMAAEGDALLYGSGFMVDSVRVDPACVKVIATPAQPDTGDVAALREALERALVGMKRPNGPTIGDVDRVERTLAALSKPNTQGREG